ncbi:MAG TPA: RNA methyltransferase [Pyrinomonadaceae bacterium]|jgi:TrmH family RNA methyltransferase
MITGRDNSLLRRARAVRDGKVDEMIFVEGLRLCEEALRSELSIEAVIYSEEIASKERAARLIDELGKVSERIASVSEKLLASISYTKTPQGIVVLASRPEMDEAKFKSSQPASPLLMVMHGINNPVNVGAILRTAEAAGVTGAITTANTADPFSPKALRGAMGSAFRLPIWTSANYASVLEWCTSRGIHSVCADAEGSITFTDFDWSHACALIVGPESSGLSADEIAAAGEAVRIPMQGPVESLNVAVATGILLYEAARQRSEVG